MDKKIWLVSIHNDSDRVSSFQGKYISMASMKLTGHLLQNGVNDSNLHIFPTDYRMTSQKIAEDISKKAESLLLDYVWFTSYVWNTPKTLEVIQALLEINDKVKVIIWWPNSINIDFNSDRVIKVIWKWEEPLLDIIRWNNFSVDSKWFYQWNKLNLPENSLQDPLRWLYYSQELLQRVSWIDDIDTSFWWYETGSWCPYKCWFCSYDIDKSWLNPHDNDKVRKEPLKRDTKNI